MNMMLPLPEPEGFVPTLRVVVTDHALLRWLERVYGADIARLRRICEMEILTSMTARANGYVPPEGSAAKFAMNAGCCVTVLSSGFVEDPGRYEGNVYLPRFVPQRAAR